MFKKIVYFFRNIPNQEEAVRKKYLIVFSTIFSLLIIASWFLLLKYTLPSPYQENQQPAESKISLKTTITKTAEKFSLNLKLFEETFKIGWQVTSQNVNNFLKNTWEKIQTPVKNLLKKENNIQIKNTEELKSYMQKYSEN